MATTCLDARVFGGSSMEFRSRCAERKLLPSPRGEFLSEALCTYAAAGINFLLGLVQRRQKLRYLSLSMHQVRTAAQSGGTRMLRAGGWQALKCRLDFLNRAHKLTVTTEVVLRVSAADAPSRPTIRGIPLCLPRPVQLVPRGLRHARLAKTHPGRTAEVVPKFFHDAQFCRSRHFTQGQSGRCRGHRENAINLTLRRQEGSPPPPEVGSVG